MWRIWALVAVLAVIGVLWINTEVERRMKELIPDAAENPAVVANKTDIENIQATLTRVENKVDTFSTEFLRYLQRQSQ